MEIPWIYYVNILAIPLLFGYLTAVNYTHTFKPRSCIYGWIMFYVLADGFGLCFQTLFGIRRLILADTWEYSLVAIAINLAVMVIVLVAPRTILWRILPRWVSREELQGMDGIPDEKKKKKGFKIFWQIFFFVIYALFLAAFFTMRWYEQTFNVDFDALLYTIAAPAKGTGQEVVQTALLKIIPPIILFLALYWVSVLRAKKHEGKEVLIMGSNEKGAVLTVGAFRGISRAFLIVNLIFLLVSTAVLLKLPEYIASISKMSTIYEENYVDPDDVKLTTADGKKRNLILVILESMETTYASTGEGGRNDINYIPNLTQLANDNISFSDTDKLGGFVSCTGTGWTMAATIATSSGVPFQFPVGQNSLGRYESIAGGLTTMGDVFDKMGYNLEVIFGSDASFAGTADYYIQHGGYKVFDLDDYYGKYVEDDFFEWWGVRDEIVFEAFKDEVTELAKSDSPFALTMFTMDTHATAGYICEICPDVYDSQLGNVLKCTDDQVLALVEWCKTQDWYEDTTIVLTGDHPRMDSRLIDNLEPEDRRVYNCILNSAKEPAEGSTNNRVFTTCDMFPTIISSMGFDIPGNMLGLGTDMLSGQQTLAEKFGLEWLNHQLAMKSNYYMTNFY